MPPAPACPRSLRSRRARPLSLLALGLCFLAACAGDDFGGVAEMGIVTGIVQGYVRDVDAPGTPPLPDIKVELNPGVEITETDTNGFYQFSNVLPGSYKITARRPGFVSHHATASATVAGGDVVLANIELGFGPGVSSTQQILYLTSNNVSSLGVTSEYGTDHTFVPVPVPPPLVEARYNRSNPEEYVVEAAPSGNSGIYLSVPSQGTQSVVIQTANSEVHPDLSPDGQRVVYAADTDADGNYEIWLVNRDGTSPVKLVDDFEATTGRHFDARDPAWSPEGITILFSLRRTDASATIDERDYEICSVRADGGPILQLTDDLFDDRDPAWHPDSTTIYYVKRASGFFNLFVSTAQQFTAEVQITNSFVDDRDSSVSLDGEFLAWTTRENVSGSNPDGSRELVAARIVGTTVEGTTLLTRSAATISISSPDFRPWYP